MASCYKCGYGNPFDHNICIQCGSLISPPTSSDLAGFLIVEMSKAFDNHISKLAWGFIQKRTIDKIKDMINAYKQGNYHKVINIGDGINGLQEYTSEINILYWSLMGDSYSHLGQFHNAREFYAGLLVVLETIGAPKDQIKLANALLSEVISRDR